MAHHYMLKEAHTISYIQQASHKWIEGDEEEIVYAQATESLKVVLNDIQHGSEVLQRFKVAHEPLVKALSSFENMESHGEPIKLIFRQLITWTLPKEGITLLKFFGGIEKPPCFLVNTIGKPRGAWPTYVSFPGAHAFQGDGPSLVYRHVLAIWDELSPEERERAMGFQTGTTNHTKVTKLERGSYKPKVRQFDVGDFVYFQRQRNDTLDTSSGHTILRIKVIRPSSVLKLQGADGCTIRDHSKNCAPCHLPNLDPTIIMSIWIPPLDYPCQVCQRTNNVDQMLFCDNCNGGYHLFCLKLELTQVLVDIWYCSSCSLVAP
ncbi:hypothetical protein CY35_01G105500 [Sphagnum magellanicum]|nr:hypothetical protein CY35_01G105500 [Sphagnum magellanicum]